MADNTTLNPGSGGDVISTESIGGVYKIPREKIVLGATDVDGGNVSGTNPFPTIISGGQSSGSYAGVQPYNTLKITPEPTTLFFDSFDAYGAGATGLDTTNKWVTPTQIGSGTATASAGILTITSGTTLSSQAVLTSIPTFYGLSPSYSALAFGLQLEAQSSNLFTNNGYRFFGIGTMATSPTTSAAIKDGIGFEINSSGIMYAVVYANGVRTAISGNLNSAVTTNGSYGRYGIYIRADNSYWLCNSLDVPIAISSFQSSTTQYLPILMCAISSASSQPTAVSMVVEGVSFSDAGKNTSQMSDGMNPWRRALVDQAGNQAVKLAAENAFHDLVTSSRYNQVEINFVSPFDSNLITFNTTGGATAVSGVNGCSTFSTTTAATAEVQAISTGTLTYRAAREWYSYFTASFTLPTDTTNTTYQRIGPYSPTDGYYIGYELVGGANVFCITQRQNGTDVHIAQSSWNGDPANGGWASKFTSGSINIFRIRGAWLDVAPIVLEVFSPDGYWVVLHTYHWPNSLTTPTTYTTTYNMQLDIKKTSSNNTNLTMSCGCWALGVDEDATRVSDPINNYSWTNLNRAILSGPVIGNNTPPNNFQNVGINAAGGLTSLNVGATASGDVLQSIQDILIMILSEMRVTNMLLTQLNGPSLDDPAILRGDETLLG